MFERFKKKHLVKKHIESEVFDSAEREDISTNSNNIEDFNDLSFILDYIGSDYVSEAKSEAIILDTLKKIKKQHRKTIRVDFNIKNGILKISECEHGALLITAPSYAVALCARDEVPGFETNFGINITRRRIHMCHVFQTGSKLEVYSITRAIALSFRCVAKDLRKIECGIDDRWSHSEEKLRYLRIRSDTTDTTREFENISRRHNKSGILPTLKSEDHLDLYEAGSQNDASCSNHSEEPVHKTSSSTDDVYQSTSYDTDFSDRPVSDDESDTFTSCNGFEDLFAQTLRAIKRHDLYHVSKFFDEDALLTVLDKRCHSLLHYAVKADDGKIVELLLKRGMDVNIEGPKDQTPLHMAAFLGYTSIARILLDYGANVRAKDQSYQTPLHLCAGSMQKLELSYILIEHGARIEDNNLDGIRPIDINIELKEMQNRLVQSTCEAFAGLEISYSRSILQSEVSRTNSQLSCSSSVLLPQNVKMNGNVFLFAEKNRHNSHQGYDNTHDASVTNLNDGTSSELSAFSINESNTDSDFERDSLQFLCNEDENQFKKKVFKKKIFYRPINHIKNDAVGNSLHILLTLLSNSECHQALLANLCLPKAACQLVAAAHSTKKIYLKYISQLLINMFNANGVTSRQKCISAGLLKTVIDLLDSPEPLQSSCLSILNDVLQQDSDRDYSTTISGIHIELLLGIICANNSLTTLPSPMMRPTFSSSVDSGYRTPLLEKRSKKLSFNEDKDLEKSPVRSNSLQNKYIKADRLLHLNSESVGPGYLDTMPSSDHSLARYASLSSVSRNGSREFDGFLRQKLISTGSSEINKERPFDRPVARHVAMKMLAASSRNEKLQDELTQSHMLSFLKNCLNDCDQEIVLYATISIANIVANIERHAQMEAENVVKYLYKLLEHPNTKIKYQAGRALVYLGHLDLANTNIYEYVPEEDSCLASIQEEDDGHLYLRGTSVENLVLSLTTNIEMLWGGISCPTRNKTRIQSIPNENQIINFVIKMYQTFVHPVILMRLLLHRFREPKAYAAFISYNNTSTTIEYYAPLPTIHARLVRFWIAWLEVGLEDFKTYPIIRNELCEVVSSMKAIGGPYAPCADYLGKLLSKSHEELCSKNVYRSPPVNHHNDLYEQCYKAIFDGSLPCSETDLVYLGGLQLYIEDLHLYGQDFPQRLNTIKGINNSRIKNSIGSQVSLSKSFSKKICSNYESFVLLQQSERNAKHNYIDCCQGMPGYGCTFFKIKEHVPSNRLSKIYITRLIGLGPKKVVILDECTKQCIEKFNEVSTWKSNDDGTIIICFKNNKVLDFQIDIINLKDFNCLLTHTMSSSIRDFHNIDTNPWSKLAEECGTWGRALQNHLSKIKTKGTISQNLNNLKEKSDDEVQKLSQGFSNSKDGTRSLPRSSIEILSFLNLKKKIKSQGIDQTNMAVSDQEFLPMFSSKVSGFTSNKVSNDIISTLENISLLVDADSCDLNHSQLIGGHHFDVEKYYTCQCPPDAEILNLNLREFSAFELLEHPRELARQITLIDHEMFCNITSKDILRKISLGYIKKLHIEKDNLHPIEDVAQRFNQMSNWIVCSIVSEPNIHRRAQMFVNFVETAKQCLEFRNYNAVMAITVAGLSSGAVRRLSGTRDLIPENVLSCLQKIENLMDSKRNHVKYRKALSNSPSPAVPYFGMYLKDLTFICDGNADYLKGGIVNLSKRRQVYSLLEEINQFQRKKYNFQEVPEVKSYLLSKSFVSEDQLHNMSKKIEPSISGAITSPVTLLGDRRGSFHIAQFMNNNSTCSFKKITRVL
ncbi:uncharacterized protein LOC100197014 isoform X1 [Hydra vulgaris]|uniref:uncharacterized protein LOC100197014 isoform X1 n=2 Tax=Hydra vulgaris TaxID=6087 RepID=UPI001F5E8695|nr:uncharacterized protein LOC100197014 isoform X1 [Hydra vulgaris]